MNIVTDNTIVICITKNRITCYICSRNNIYCTFYWNRIYWKAVNSKVYLSIIWWNTSLNRYCFDSISILFKVSNCYIFNLSFTREFFVNLISLKSDCNRNRTCLRLNFFCLCTVCIKCNIVKKSILISILFFAFIHCIKIFFSISYRFNWEVCIIRNRVCSFKNRTYIYVTVFILINCLSWNTF